MALKIIETINEQVLPVKEGKLVSEVSVYYCRDFKGKISSTSGIISRNLYVPKINQLTGSVESPTIKIICCDECTDRCKYIN